MRCLPVAEGGQQVQGGGGEGDQDNLLITILDQGHDRGFSTD